MVGGGGQPDNLVVGAEGAGREQLHLIDFGTAEALVDRHGRARLDAQAPEGTPAFMAVSAHAQRPVSPRDDLEALGSARSTSLSLSLSLPPSLLSPPSLSDTPSSLSLSLALSFSGPGPSPPHTLSLSL